MGFQSTKSQIRHFKRNLRRKSYLMSRIGNFALLSGKPFPQKALAKKEPPETLISGGLDVVFDLLGSRFWLHSAIARFAARFGLWDRCQRRFVFFFRRTTFVVTRLRRLPVHDAFDLIGPKDV